MSLKPLNCTSSFRPSCLYFIPYSLTLSFFSFLIFDTIVEFNQALSETAEYPDVLGVCLPSSEHRVKPTDLMLSYQQFLCVSTKFNRSSAHDKFSQILLLRLSVLMAFERKPHSACSKQQSCKSFQFSS